MLSLTNRMTECLGCAKRRYLEERKSVTKKDLTYLIRLIGKKRKGAISTGSVDIVNKVIC